MRYNLCMTHHFNRNLAKLRYLHRRGEMLRMYHYYTSSQWAANKVCYCECAPPNTAQSKALMFTMCCKCHTLAILSNPSHFVSACRFSLNGLITSLSLTFRIRKTFHYFFFFFFLCFANDAQNSKSSRTVWCHMTFNNRLMIHKHWVGSAHARSLAHAKETIPRFHYGLNDAQTTWR